MTETVLDIARRHDAAPQERPFEDCPVLRAGPDAAPALHEDLRGAGYSLLADLWGVDARAEGEMRLASHLISPERNADIRIEVPLEPDAPQARSVAASHPNAAWYEREAWDMFGIRFDDPARHRRILNPPTWQGHPLRKDAPARATEEPPFRLPPDRFAAEEAALQADTADLGLPEGTEAMVLNFGPHHPSAHGVFRVILGLEGERIVAARPDIGYHHRGVEKMAERQTWHGFIPYTDRVDYLGGTTSELPYLMAVERLAGIEIPQRARLTRILLAELFRVMNHLLFLGTMAQDTGALSPVFYMFRDRERIYDAIEAITGARMHPGFFRIGGMALDLPEGWQAPLRAVLDWMPGRLDDYDRMVLENEIFRARTVDVAPMDTGFALARGITGPMLRATGCGWDWRRARPYLGYEALDFDVPVGTAGDCWDRTKVRLEEMRQSLRIVRQCVDRMPAGPIKADHPLTTPPPRARMLHDIETLVQHFMGVTWGPNIPAGHATGQVESVRGLTQYAATSNGGPMAERLRIRTPSFAHLQCVSEMAPGLSVADFVAFLGSVDFVMSDVDR